MRILNQLGKPKILKADREAHLQPQNQTRYVYVIYAGQPILDTQHNKEIKINEINKDRTKYNVDTRYRKGTLQKGKLENPFELTRNVEQTDDDHYKITNRNRETL